MAEVQEVRIRMAVDTKGLDTATAKTKLLEKEIELSEKKTKQLTADFNQLQAALHKATDPKEVARLNKELDKVEANLLQAQKATLNAQQAMQGMGKQTNLVQQALKQIGPQIAAAFSIAAIGAFVKKSIDLSAAFEQNVISIEQFVGSTDKAKKLLRELEQFAAKTPFEFPEIADSAKRLLAFGVGAENITDTLKRLGDIAAGTGQPLGDISLIYGQILAKGKLQGEELLQFAEKGVPLLQGVADVLGKSTGETQKLISAGKVGFKEVEQAIINMTNEGGKFFNLTEKQSQSLSGVLSTFYDTLGQITRQIGDFLAPAIKTALNWFNQLFGGDQRRSTALKNEQAEINALVTSISGLNEGNSVRAELIKTLNEKYPDFLGNLDAEKVTNEQIRDRLKEVNEEYRKKIILAANEEKIAEEAKKVSDTYKQIIDNTQLAGQMIAEYNNKAAALGGKQIDITQSLNNQLSDLAWNYEQLAKTAGPSSQGGRMTEFFNQASAAKNLRQELIDLNNQYQQGTKSVADLQIFLDNLAKQFGVTTTATNKNTNAGKANAGAVTATGNAAQKAKEEIVSFDSAISKLAGSLSNNAKEAGRFGQIMYSLDYLSSVVNNLEDLLNQTNVGSRQWMEYAEKVKKARMELQFFKDKADLLMGGIQTVTPNVPTMPGMEEAGRKMGESSGAAFKDGFSTNVEAGVDEAAFKLQEWMKKAMPIIQSMVSLINEIFTLQSELIQRNLEQEMAAIDKRYNKEIQAAKGNRIEIAKIDKKYREDKAKAEAAARRKEQQIAIAQALINGAIAITNIIATTPIPLWPVIIPISAATTAAQIALIASQKFAKGVIDLKGPGHETSDSIPAMLSRGESVMTARETREWKPLLQAIRRRDVIPGPMGMPVFRDDRKINVSASLNDRKIIATLQEQNAILRQVVKRNRYSATSEFSDKKRLPYG